jgi:hypothetical protein
MKTFQCSAEQFRGDQFLDALKIRDAFLGNLIGLLVLTSLDFDNPLFIPRQNGNSAMRMRYGGCKSHRSKFKLDKNTGP